MNLLYSIQTALANLNANRLRSMLTMLGVIIGVSAVIVMVSIIQGASDRVTNEFKRLGSNLIIVSYQPTDEEVKQTTRRITGLTNEDVQAIREQCDTIQSFSAEVALGSGSAQYAGRQIDVSMAGVQPDYERLRNVEVAHGRFITQHDLDTWAKVCVIGSQVAANLFRGQEPLGNTLTVNGANLTVVGVLAHKGRTFEGDADKSFYLPLTTAQKRILGRESIAVVWAQPKTSASLEDAMNQIWQLLMRRYHNLPGFHVDSQENILKSINRILAVFGIILGSIAGLALLVGGIGIMNIMLVSVTERTREIGIRKAIGAKRRDILIQFLIESAVVSGTGGLIGIGVGASISALIGYVTSFVPSLVDPSTGAKGIAVSFPLTFAIGSFLFSAFVGVFFGIYPAIRASRLDPIQALRHE